MTRIILHVDMDAFFAAIEIRERPELKGLPVVIGALPHERGVVSTASYEARKYGIHSAMNIKEAYQRCPQAVFIKPRISLYSKVSKALHQIWLSYSSRVEFLSLDEGYIDLSADNMDFTKARLIAQQIKHRTREEENLTCSVGLAFNKSAAKIASEECKPDGLFIIEDIPSWQRLIYPRPVHILRGVGPATAKKLHKLGIYQVSDLLAKRHIVEMMFGQHGQDLLAQALGYDERPVVPYYEEETKSFGKERTLQVDSLDKVFLKDLLRIFARDLSNKLKAEKLYARSVSLKLCYNNMQNLSRSATAEATDSAAIIYQRATKLLDSLTLHYPVRLIGISLSSLTRERYEQMSLADLSAKGAEKAKQRRLQETLDAMSAKYGQVYLGTAAELEARQNVHKRLKESK